MISDLRSLQRQVRQRHLYIARELQRFALQRLVKLEDAPQFLGMSKKEFDEVIRPNVTELSCYSEILFDRPELTEYSEKHKLSKPQSTPCLSASSCDPSDESKGPNNEGP